VRPGPRARQAWFHESLGDTFRAAAGSAKPALPQRDGWRRARAEYTRAVALWNEIAHDKPLEGNDAQNPERLRAAIADCDRALAQLGGTPLTPGRN
jgi:hypothetical protein